MSTQSSNHASHERSSVRSYGRNKSRRGSRGSSSSVSIIDKDSFGHALQTIHQSASKSAGLTTFNEFPTSTAGSSIQEDRGIASQLQSGIGGVYSRLVASVAGTQTNAQSTVSQGRADSPVHTRPPTRSKDDLHSSMKPAHKRQRSKESGNRESISSLSRHSLQSDEQVSGVPLRSKVKILKKTEAVTRGDESPSPAVHFTEGDVSSESQMGESSSRTGNADESLGDRSPFTFPKTQENVSLRSSFDGSNTKAQARGQIGGLDHTPSIRAESFEDGSRASSPARDSLQRLNIGSTPRLGSSDSRPRLLPTRESTVGQSRQTGDHSRFRPLAGERTAASSLLSLRGVYPDSTGSDNTDAQQTRLLNEMRRKVISRDFWMKDENARVCFNCGDRFSTFRRKHHCRTCGQIFDAKCTILMPGDLFGQDGRIRVCKVCVAMIQGDDSSEYSDEDDPSLPHGRSIRFSEIPAEVKLSAAGSAALTPATEVLGRPTDPRKRPPSGYFDNLPVLARPSSSRSLKSLAARPRSNHRPRWSRGQHVRSMVMGPGESVPFQHSHSSSGLANNGRFSTFHKDAIIDPDLAPFLSDDEMSDEEFASMDNILKSQDMARDPSNQSQSGNGPNLRHRPKSSSRSLADVIMSRDPDTASITSTRAGLRRKQLGLRTFSTNSVISRHTTTPRIIRSENLFSHQDPSQYAGLGTTPVDTDKTAVIDDTIPHAVDTSIADTGTDLGRNGVRFVSKMLSQFLTDLALESADVWIKTIVPLVIRCASDVDPNISRGDNIDIRHYIKVKRAPGGLPRDTRYISGVVFGKNLALKDMARSIRQPRIMLISFPLEYARHQKHFMSLEPVIVQEKEYLWNLVNRIALSRANILLVQGNVSGIAIEYLHKANIAVAYNVKESAIRAVARCTQARLITSVDKLTVNQSALGHCDSFEVKTFMHEGTKKTQMYFEGCQKDLGCTLVLRGASGEILSKIKPVIEFLTYLVYNLKLENSLLRDEFVSLLVNEQDPGNDDGLLTKLNQSLSKVSGMTEAEEPLGDVINERFGQPTNESLRDAPSAYSGMVKDLNNRLLSISPCVQFSAPYLLLRGHEQEREMKKLSNLMSESSHEDFDEKEGVATRKKFQLVQPDMVYSAAKSSPPQIKEALQAIHQSEYDKAFHRYTNLKRRWEAYIVGHNDPFSPLNHQHIIILFSIMSSKSDNTCLGPDLLCLDFYQEQHYDDGLSTDLPLGEFIERLASQADMQCIAQQCDSKMTDHYRRYVHGDGQVLIQMQRTSSKIRGMENTILMWSRCRKCDYESQVTPMSSSAWKYSFGKYLELTFWGRPLHSRAGSCTHDVHKDHSRYFGFQGVAIKAQYDPINIMEVIVPRGTVAWKVDKDLEVKNAEYRRMEERLSRFMMSVKTRIRSIKLESIEPDKADTCKEAVGTMLKRAGDEHDMLLEKLQEKYSSSKFYEVIPMNRAVRALQERVADWDNTFADFEQQFFPSEKDIRRLATQQLKKMYLSAAEPMATDEDQSYIENEPLLTERLSEAVIDGDPTPSLQHDVENALRNAHHEEAISNLSLHDRDERAVDHLDLAVSVTSLSSQPAKDIGQSPMSDRTITEFIKPIELGEESLKGQIEDLHGDDLKPSIRTGETAHPESPIKVSDRPTSPQLVRSATSPVVATRKSIHEANIQSSAIGGSSSQAVASVSSKPERHNSLIPTPSRNKATASTSRTERFMSDRLGISALMAGKTAVQSLIPRPISYKQTESKVSALAKHFEAMSRQFEKERLRERRQRAEKNRLSRVYPMSSFRPVIEVFKDASEAARDQDMSTMKQSIASTSTFDGEVDLQSQEQEEAGFTAAELPESSMSHEQQDVVSVDNGGTVCENVETEDLLSDTEALLSDSEMTNGLSSKEGSGGLEQMIESGESTGEIPFDLPRHDKNSLMKVLTSFWSERSASGWTPLEYPLVATDHIFADSDIIVREDEPSSLIAFSLDSDDYRAKLQRFREKQRAVEERRGSIDLLRNMMDAPMAEEDTEVERTLLGQTATHMKYQFQAGSARMQCKVFYAESFDAIRRKCGVSERFVESLSRCLKWDSKGGKTKSLFLKTLDERFIIKSLSLVETQAFLKFAPDYFDYMSKCLFHSLPSALAKMLGFYHVVIKNPVTGTDLSYFLQVMENVFYEGPSNLMFDLKGSMRNRRVESTGEKNEVLLDENMLDFMSQSPVYIRYHSSSLLSSSISNDTLFCSKQNVMDYSLIVGLYNDRKELMVGIIDYIRTYTWDKKLESWIKDRGKHKATVRSPKEYRNRFRASIPQYFPLAPSSWHMFGMQRQEPLMAWQGGFEGDVSEYDDEDDDEEEQDGRDEYQET